MRQAEIRRLQNDEQFMRELLSYLEGEDVSTEWIRAVTKLRDPCPETLYRLMLVSNRRTLYQGKELRLSNSVASTSDRAVNAVYAGSSYHYDYGTYLTSTQIALVEIQNAQCLLNFQSIHALLDYQKCPFVTQSGSNFCRKRLRGEREYLIQGKGSIGTVKYFTDSSYISDRHFRLLREL